MSPQRRLTYDFLELPYVVKVEIAAEFGVIREDYPEPSNPTNPVRASQPGSDQDFYIKVFRTVRDAGRLEEFRTRVTRAMEELAN